MKFREGDRVRYSPDLIDLSRDRMPPIGTLGTVKKVRGIRGRSVHPDPMKSMVYVEWDTGHRGGVGLRSAEKTGEREANNAAR
jgi:hypothetical protein